MKTMENKTKGEIFSPFYQEEDEEIIERFTQELLKEYPLLSEEEGIEFISWLYRVLIAVFDI